MDVCSASLIEPMLSLSDWLDGIQKTVINSIQQCRDPESQGGSLLLTLPCIPFSMGSRATQRVACILLN